MGDRFKSSCIFSEIRSGTRNHINFVPLIRRKEFTIEGILKKSNKKIVSEPENGGTKITVCIVYGEQSILDLYSEYMAEKVRAQRRAGEAAKKAG